jgi:hypothetical protein
MRKLIVIITTSAAILLASSVARQADAQISLAAAGIPAQARSLAPVETAACWRWQRDGCPYHMKRGRFRRHEQCVACLHGD